jgi:hypothetical protein
VTVFWDYKTVYPGDDDNTRLQVLCEASVECFHEKKLWVVSQKTVTEGLLSQRGSESHVVEDAALAL